MRTVYSSWYEIDLGSHIYPTAKYRRVHDALIAEGLLQPQHVVDPDPASWDDLALVHTPDYLRRIRENQLTPAEIAQLELPFSIELAEGFRRMTGGTLAAGRLAVDSPESARGAEGPASGKNSPGPAGSVDAPPHRRRWRVTAHLGGGFHHAFANHGEGFCLFNDVAVAIRALRRDRLIERATIVDLDVHHGNGTAFIFERDPDVVTFSMHQQHNYPVFKPKSVLDVGLEDGTGDEVYLAKLAAALPRILDGSSDVVFYLAGADPYEHDQLGGLNLTFQGLRDRDACVLAACRERLIPVVIVLAGGYAQRLEDTVRIHVETIRQARLMEAEERSVTSDE